MVCRSGDWKERKGNLKTDMTYEQIKKHKTQIELFEDDFNDCDSGYCDYKNFSGVLKMIFKYHKT